MTPEGPHTTVQSTLAAMIARCGKTHRSIAEEAGFPRPNVISMMKLGRMKVPLDKAPAIATACGGDPSAFTRQVMREYEPEAWSALERAFGEPLDETERVALEVVRTLRRRGLLTASRDAAGGLDLDARADGL